MQSEPDELTAWLDAGEPRAYFGFGGMPVLDPAGLVDAVTRWTAECGVRGLIAVGWSDYSGLADRLPGHLFLATDVHDHNGGVLRTGLPYVIESVFSDQPFWSSARA